MSTQKRETRAVGAQIQKEKAEEIRLIALEESSPDDRVSQSDIIRQALSEHLDIPLEELEP